MADDTYKDPVATTIKDLGEQLAAMKADLSKLPGATKEAPKDRDTVPVEGVKKEFSSIFKKLHDSLNGLQGVKSGGVTGVQSAEPPQGTATIDNKSPKVKLDPETIEALTGDRKGFKGRKDRVKKTKREQLGLRELPHESAGAAAADALINKKKGLRGATVSAVEFTANKVKQSLIEKFDPLRAINRATGGSKIATVLAGKAMFRSEKSIRQIAGMDRRLGLEGSSADRAQESPGVKEQDQSPSRMSSGAPEQKGNVLQVIQRGFSHVAAILMRIAERQGVAVKHLGELAEANQEMLKMDEQASDEAKAKEAGQESQSPVAAQSRAEGPADLGGIFDKIFDLIINKGFSVILKSVLKWAPLVIAGLVAAFVAFKTDWVKLWDDLLLSWDNMVEDIKGWFKGMWESIKTVWADITDPVVAVFDDLIGGITTKIEELWTMIKPFWETISGAIKQVVDAVMGKVNAVLEFLGIKDAPTAESAPSSSPGVVSGAIGGIKKFFGGSEAPPTVATAAPATVGAQRQEIPVAQTGQALQQAHDNKEQAAVKGVAMVTTTNANKTTNVTNNNTSLSGIPANPRNSESSFMRAMGHSFAPS